MWFKWVIGSIHDLPGWVKRLAISMLFIGDTMTENQISPKYRYLERLSKYPVFAVIFHFLQKYCFLWLTYAVKYKRSTVIILDVLHNYYPYVSFFFFSSIQRTWQQLVQIIYFFDSLGDHLNYPIIWKYCRYHLVMPNVPLEFLPMQDSVGCDYFHIPVKI